MKDAHDSETYDYIIVGAGSAGCTLANRLTEDPDVTVCLLEAGGTHEHWSVRVPLAAIVNMVTKKRNWAFETVPQPGLNGRRGYQPRGKMLGGSSSLNAMIYIRGVPSDYDTWEALGNRGWGYEDVLPYFKKAEHREAGGNAWRGEGGPLNVAPLRSPGSNNERFFRAADELQIPRNPDFNGERQEGVGLYEVTQKNGERWSAARAYLDPIRDRPNLTVLTGAMTEKVIVEGDRAVGVSAKVGGKPRTLHAAREVILSAGSFGSPQLLLLSGIGPKDKLAPHGIKQVHDLPGVGENLQDHIDYVMAFKGRVKDNVGVSAGFAARFLGELRNYIKHRRGVVTTNYAEGGGFVYTDRSEPAPDIQIILVRSVVDDHGRNLHSGQGYSIHTIVQRPVSRGSVWLNSADPTAPPAIDPAFFADERDLDRMVKGVRITKQLLASSAFDGVRGPGYYASDTEDEAELREDIRNRADTEYHPIGTCKMGHDPLAVVDDRLRVHGLRSLRVIDASIMPNMVSGNTNAPTIMIAEKGADMLKDDARQAAFRDAAE